MKQLLFFLLIFLLILIKLSIAQAISMSDNGNFVITWNTYNGDDGIYVQRYSSDGIAMGNNFKVYDDRGLPSISSDNSGNFVLAWGAFDCFLAQSFSSDGTALGSNFEFSDVSDTTGNWNADVAMDDNGNFVVAWEEHQVFAQRYSSDGIRIGTNFIVSEDGWSGADPSISSDRSGNFVIVWEKREVHNTDIHAQRYANDGNKIGSYFRVAYDEGDQINPSVAVDGNGNFVIVWTDDQEGYNIYAQRYSSDGTAIGNSFKVNDGSLGNGNSSRHSISADDKGNFVITWNDLIDLGKIKAQRYSEDGDPIGETFIVDHIAWDGQQHGFHPVPSISSDGNGNFTIVWKNYIDGNYNIYAQRYSSDGTAIGSIFQVNDNTLGINTDDPTQIPLVYKLNQNYPNPFNPSTTIEYDLPKTSDVKIDIYNTTGQRIQTLINKKMSAGNHQVEFNASNLSSGIYFYKIEAGEFQDVKKMILLR